RRGFMDRSWFEAPVFLRRVRVRLDSLRNAPPARDPVTGRGLNHVPEPPSSAVTVANELVWLEVNYGPVNDNNRLAGALGRVTLSGLSDEEIDLLVLGQYVAVGEATRFGCGRYRLDELGPEPFACRRAVAPLATLLTAQ